MRDSTPRAAPGAPAGPPREIRRPSTAGPITYVPRAIKESKRSRQMMHGINIALSMQGPFPAPVMMAAATTIDLVSSLPARP